ncbi:GNAT family N-acetyltransferase [Streptomyces sp. NPDC059578]|uniref:GNAT family N-acetyltransferase n=1 Tax=Streptomyces sp. NPDC059578 TaxID=3346874 RepID=UPI0036A754F8
MTETRFPFHEAIRRATPVDAGAVKSVTDAAYAHYVERIGRRPAPMEADHAAQIAAGQVFVTGEPVLGLVVLVPYEDHLHLDNIAVHPDSHGLGVGRRLLHFVDAHARDLGLPEVRLHTHAQMWENQKLYPRYGYEFMGRRPDGHYDRYHYRKRFG